MKILSLILITFYSLVTHISYAHAGLDVIYRHGDIALEGYIAKPDANKYSGVRPTILIAHQWKGLGGYEKKRADMLADLGYIAFAIDVYGQNTRPDTQGKAKAESSKYKDNPELARGRMMTALNFIKTVDDVDINNIAAIGYCFGGTMVLEMARAGADIDAVVSFHGGLATQSSAQADDNILTSIQIHHGAADPYVSDIEVSAFKQEMVTAKTDWHFISYANAVHAFTEKEAGNDPSKGAAYNQKADERSWSYTLDFLKMTFAQ